MARRADELPERLRTPTRVFQARRHRRREEKDSGLTEEFEGEPAGEPEAQPAEAVPLKFDAARIVARTQGREGWVREGRRQLEQHRWRHPDPVCRSRHERLLLAAERLEGDLDTERRANEVYEHYRVTARDRLGRRPADGRTRLGRPPCRQARST
jgi:hypothetical protein